MKQAAVLIAALCVALFFSSQLRGEEPKAAGPVADAAKAVEDATAALAGAFNEAKLDAARAGLEKALKASPDNKTAAELLKKVQDAFAALKASLAEMKSLEFKIKDADQREVKVALYLKIAEECEKINDQSQARDVLDLVLKEFPDTKFVPTVYLAMAKSALKSGEADVAEVILKKIIENHKLSDESYEAQDLLLDLQLKNEKWDAFVAGAKQIIEKEPDSLKARGLCERMLEVLFEKSLNYSQFLAEAVAYASRYPEKEVKWQILFRMGLCQEYIMRNYDDAARIYRRVATSHADRLSANDAKTVAACVARVKEKSDGAKGKEPEVKSGEEMQTPGNAVLSFIRTLKKMDRLSLGVYVGGAFAEEMKKKEFAARLRQLAKGFVFSDAELGVPEKVMDGDKEFTDIKVSLTSADGSVETAVFRLAVGDKLWKIVGLKY